MPRQNYLVDIAEKLDMMFLKNMKNRIKIWFYWTFDKKGWTKIKSWKTGDLVSLNFHKHCFSTGDYPEVEQKWKHRTGLIKYTKSFEFELRVLEPCLGYKGGSTTWTGPK